MGDSPVSRLSRIRKAKILLSPIYLAPLFFTFCSSLFRAASFIWEIARARCFIETETVQKWDTKDSKIRIHSCLIQREKKQRKRWGEAKGKELYSPSAGESLPCTTILLCKRCLSTVQISSNFTCRGAKKLLYYKAACGSPFIRWL